MIKLAAILIALATPSIAGPDRVSLLIGSHHAGAQMHFEESNPGVFFTWEKDRVDWSLGVYRNSFGRTSVAVTGALPVYSEGVVEVSLFAGLALYPEDGRYFAAHMGDVVAIGGVQARVGNMFVQVIPSDGKAVAAIISVGMTFPLH